MLKKKIPLSPLKKCCERREREKKNKKKKLHMFGQLGALMKDGEGICLNILFTDCSQNK